MMDCKDQEKALFRLLSEEIDATERTRLLDALAAHAERCSACAGDRTLLDWVAAQPAALAADEDPGQEYWDGFEARVEQRLEEQPGSGGESAPPQQPMRPVQGAALPWMALAATLLFGLIGWALIVTTNREPAQEATLRQERPQAPAAVKAPALPTTPSTPLSGEVISESAEGLLADATAAREQFERELQELGLFDEPEALGALEGRDPEDSIEVQAAGWLPDLTELDDATQAEMLLWLEERI